MELLLSQEKDVRIVMVNESGTKISPLDEIKDDVIILLKTYWGSIPQIIRQIRVQHNVSTTRQSIERALIRWKMSFNLLTPRENLPFHLKTALSPVEILDKKQIFEDDIHAHFENIQRVQESYWRVSRMQESMHARFNFNQPIGVAFLGDLHLGAEGTRHDLITDVLDLILSVEGCYVGLHGDYADNMIWQRAGGNRELYPAFIQRQMAKSVIEQLFRRTLYMLQGCHDEFSRQYDDFDLGDYLSSHSMGSYLGAGGDVYLDVFGAPYHLHVRHKYPGMSALNIENSHRRMYDGVGSFDIGVLGHSHKPFMMHLTRGSGMHRKNVVYLNAGTAKIYDRWISHKHGGFGAEFAVPMVILMPERQNIIPFKHLRTGLRVLESLRKDWNEEREQD